MDSYRATAPANGTGLPVFNSLPLARGNQVGPTKCQFAGVGYAGRSSQGGPLEKRRMKPYYEEGGIVIYHGDCREVIPTLPKVDLVLTDPPYGIGEAAGKNKSRSKLAVSKDYGNSDWDNRPPDSLVFDLIRSISEKQIIFGGNYFPLPPTKCWLIWDKENGASDFADAEMAWTNLDKAVRLLRFRWAGMLQKDMLHKEFRDHPTQKPVPVMQWALEHAGSVKSVIDPFMGSGTTLVACKRVGLQCIGIEIEEKYCAIATKRLAQGVLWGAE